MGGYPGIIERTVIGSWGLAVGLLVSVALQALVGSEGADHVLPRRSERVALSFNDIRNIEMRSSPVDIRGHIDTRPSTFLDRNTAHNAASGDGHREEEILEAEHCVSCQGRDAMLDGLCILAILYDGARR